MPYSDRSRRLRQRFFYKIGAEFTVAATVLVLIGLASYESFREFENTSDWVTHTQEEMAALHAVSSHTLGAVSAVRGYLVTGKERFLEPYKKALTSLDHDQTRLATLLQDNPEQVQRFERLKRLIGQQLDVLKALIARRNHAASTPAQIESSMDQSKAIMDSIRVTIKDMQDVEKALLLAREQHADAKGRNAILTSVIGDILDILILIWVALQIRREIAARQQAQEHLQQARDELEVRIRQRTKDLEEANQRLRLLSSRLIAVQEEERRHIARDLHDEIGQSLTAMKLSLREVHNLSYGRATASFLADSLEILDQVIQNVRSLALDLRPSLLDELGLVPALKWCVNRQGVRAGWEAEFSADQAIDRFPAEVEIACFRVAQEALTNVARHAEATHVRVRLSQQNGHLWLEIEDNGKGFDIDGARALAKTGTSMGLLGMEERVRLVGGQMAILSSRGTGTRIRVGVPLVAPSQQPVESVEKAA